MLLHQEVTRITFNAEKEMRRLLDVKGKTEGLKTDKIEVKNLHVFLTEVAVFFFFFKQKTAYDIASPVGSTSIKLSAVDLEMVLLSNEKALPINIVDPSVLLLPPSLRSDCR